MDRIKDHKLFFLAGITLCLLLLKFVSPLFRFDIPLGYDPGIYRYLFIVYSESLASLSLPDLLPWAKEYPPGLFFLFTPFILLGLPVDAIIGWIWNLVPIATLMLLAWVTAKRSSTEVGVALLIVGLLSQAYYDGFFAMYWKAYAALFLVVLTYHLAEKMSLWFIVAALLAVMTHQQTALVMVIALAVWWVVRIRDQWKNPKYRLLTLLLGCSALLAAAWYLPQWERAIWSPLKSIILLRGDKAPAGAFPGLDYYTRTTGLLLLLGIVGFCKSFRQERCSLWQVSVIVCAVFVLCKLVFYKRFFLQLDFFLMPFAAVELVALWHLCVRRHITIVVIALVAIQMSLSWKALLQRTPRYSAATLKEIKQLEKTIPKSSAIIALENVSGTWLRGWLPYHTVGAPGLFDYPSWTITDWEMFIDGSQAQRKALLQQLQSPVYFFLTEPFAQFYGDRAVRITEDPCLQFVDNAPLLESFCSP